MYAKIVLNLERALIPATQCAEGVGGGTSLAAVWGGHLITQDVMIHCQKARYFAKDESPSRQIHKELSL